MKEELKGLWIVPVLGITLVGTILLLKKLSNVTITNDGVKFGKGK